MAAHKHLQETGTFPFTFSLGCPHKEDENIVAVVECYLDQNTRGISSQLRAPHVSLVGITV